MIFGIYLPYGSTPVISRTGSVYSRLAGAGRPLANYHPNGRGGTSAPAAAVSATSIGLSTELTTNLLGFPLGQQTSFGLGCNLAIDPSGNVFVAAMGQLYEITPAGSATHIAGNGIIGFNTGNGVALNASLGLVSGLAADGNGNVYVADTLNLAIWKVNVPRGSIVLLAGIPTPVYTGLTILNGLESWVQTGDGGPAANAALAPPSGLALDNQDNLYVLTANGIRKINLSTGSIGTVLLTGPHAAEASPALSYPAEASLLIALVYGFAIDPNFSTLYTLGVDSSDNPVIVGVDLCTGAVSEIADASPVGGMGFDTQGNLYVADSRGIVKIPGGTGTPAVLLPLSNAVTYPLAVDSANNIYYGYNQYIYKTNTSGAAPVLFAGDGSFNYDGDGPAAQASFAFINGSAADALGNVYVADTFNNRVRKISAASQTISTVAGTSVPGFNGDGPDATKAQLNLPSCLAVDSAGQNLYIADTQNQRVRKVVLSTGAISTMANVSPQCIALDANGHLYILESGESFQLDQVTLSTGAISTVSVAGADNLSDQLTLASDPAGNLYIADTQASLVFQIVGGALTPLAGQEDLGYTYSGDGGPALSAGLNQPFSLSADGHGNLFIADFGNFRIRRVDLTANPPKIYLVAGNGGNVYTGEGGPPACTGVTPTTVAADGLGNLFSTDGTGKVLEILNAAGSPSSSVPEIVNVSPANVGLQFSVNGAAGSTPQTPAWTLNSTNTLSAAASQQGSDGLTYQLAGWSDGSTLASHSVTAACPATYTALYNPTGCTFTINNPSALIVSDGDDGPGASGYFEITAPPGSNCSWVATSQNPDWLTVTGKAGGTGSGMISFAATSNENSSNSRTGTITAGGLAFTVTQLAGNDPSGTGAVPTCSFFITAPPYDPPALPPGGGTGVFFLTGVGCTFFADSNLPWSVSTDSTWLHIASATSGDTTSSVTYSADPNSGAASRTGHVLVITPSGPLSYSVTQAPAGANWALSATSASAAANGGTGTVEVALVETACGSWTAVSNVPWITVDTPIGPASGSGEASYTVAANPGAQRGGTITIAGSPFTVTQSAGGTCTFGLTASSAQAPSGGGTGAFSLTASNPLCYWSAVSSAPAWLTLTTPDDGAGGTSIGWSAASNATGGSRSATITVGGQTFTVNQAAPVAISIQTSPLGLQVSVDGTAYTAPQTLDLPPGAHTIAVAATQSGGTGTQYVFTGWNDNGAASHSITVGTSPATYTASFNTQYQLTTAASPAVGGTVTPASGAFYNASSMVNINATANSGYAFTSWTGSVASSASPSTSVTMTGPLSVTANFSTGTPITIQTVPAGLQFTIDGGAPQTAPQTVGLSPGSHTLAVAATQAGASGTQYLFASWSDGGQASHSITVGSSSATYTATFTTQYQLTISASPAAGGTVTPATVAFYNSGTSVPVAASANSGYAFTGWTGAVALPTSASTTVTMSGPETVVANFSSLTGITIQTAPPGLQFAVDGGMAQTAPQNLNLPAGTHTIAVATPQAGPSGTPSGTQYVFSSWSDGGAASHSITVGASAAAYTATFTTQYQLTISASPFAGGTVIPTSGGFYNAGSSVPIAATASSGYNFANWTGNVASASSASTSIMMSAPETVVANFTSPNAITIQTTPEGLQFTVDGGAPQTAPQTLTLSQGPHTIAVAPTQAGTAGTQYTFIAWSDSGLATHTIAVATSAATYIATFQTQYQLTISASPAADGTVSPASGGFYNAGSSVPVAATSASGFQFSNWTGSVASASTASTTVTMSAPEAVVANFTAAATTSGLAFYPVTPCRVVDTRNATGPFGGPILSAGSTRSFAISSSACNIPSAAQAYSLNITVVPPAPLGYLTAWPAGQTQPYVSTLNSSNGAIIANAAIVPAGTGGAISIYVSDSTHVIIDINGYFAASSGSTALAFYPVTPCRVVDTRNANGPFGGPSLAAGATRNFTVPQSACNIPATAQAYSLNMTAAPPAALEYLSAWPTGQAQPVVSTLNALQGQIAANAAIVPAGTSGAISVYVSDASNVIIDINGYFGPPGGTGALYFYPVTPCRVADTRNANGTFGGPSLGASATRIFPIPSSSCGAPTTAQAYSFNMTVVPPGSLLYLSTWPAGQTQPVVSTLNDLQGQIVANAAIVPAGTSGGISVFVSDATNLVIDINGYFRQ